MAFYPSNEGFTWRKARVMEAFTFTYFASARLIDIFIGTIIGLIGVFFAGRRSASSRLPHLITKTIRSQAQFLFILFSDQGTGFNANISSSKNEFRPILSDKTLSQLLYVCETMANAANRIQSPSIKNVPEIEEFPSIQHEIITLQKSLQINKSNPY
ncbi:hypothetical protein ACIQAA_15610 [Neobacillus sp. NPDC093182]|uniref:hypothetical protein n=1 Tax=Neobacillus sp. NPDC093182 TaxID=3364297 RepID=UPI00381965A7